MIKKIFMCLSFIALLGFVGVVVRWDTTPEIATKCAFCDQKVLERQSFYEGDLSLCLLTHKPVTSGHCLILPKRHVERFEDLNPAEVNEMMTMIKKVHHATCKIQGTTSYVLYQKNGREAFQTVPHVHFHYIPRAIGHYSQLGFGFQFFVSSIRDKLSAEFLKSATAQMREAMSDEVVVQGSTVPS